MKSISLALCTLAALAHAQAEYQEPEDFDVRAALVGKGVDTSLIPPIKSGARPSLRTACSTACNALLFTYGEDTVELPGETAYASFSSSFWSAIQAETRPACVVKPSTPEDVSVAVLIARLTQCPFAARSGGHAAFKGASSSDGGITISFENMLDIQLSQDKTTAAIQPGNIWYRVYSELAKDDLIVIGGRAWDIGIGGFTTGGGISFFSNIYGWGADNVRSYKVVTATGTIVTASATQNRDLYWALRGGGNNFGLVVEFTLETYPLPNSQLWAGNLVFLPSDHPAVLDAFANYAANSALDPAAGCFVAFLPSNGTTLALSTLYHAVPSLAPSSPLITPFLASTAPISSTLGPKSLANYTLSVGGPQSTRAAFFSVSFRLSRPLLSAVLEAYQAALPPVASVAGFLPVFVLQAITVPQLQRMQRNGGNALGLSEDDGPLVNVLVSPYWTDAKDDGRVYRFCHVLVDAIEALAGEAGMGSRYRYMNYAGLTQDVVAGYGEGSKRRLMAVARRVDPTGVWQRLQGGYFKLEGAPYEREEVESWEGSSGR